MNKDLKIVRTPSNMKLWAFLLDLIVLIASSFILFAVCFYAFVLPLSTYEDNSNLIQNKLEQYHLNYGGDLDREDYESATKEFYLIHFKDELIEYYSPSDETYSIEHIYNIYVLGLPVEPTVEFHSNTYFAYVENDDNTFNVDVIGYEIDTDNTNPNYVRNVRDIFYTAYNSLPQLLSKFDASFNKALMNNALYLGLTRISVFSFSVIVLYIIIPLTNKYRHTLFEKLFKIAHVNDKDGFLIKGYKAVLRPIIYFIIPLIGVYFYSTYAIIILGIIPIFVSIIMMLFSKTNHDLADKILKMESVDISQSLLFKEQAEENVYERSDEYQVVEDASFIEKLDNTEVIDLSTSNDEKIKKQIDKD